MIFSGRLVIFFSVPAFRVLKSVQRIQLHTRTSLSLPVTELWLLFQWCYIRTKVYVS